MPMQGQQGGYMHQQNMNYGDQVPGNQMMDQGGQPQQQMTMNQNYQQQIRAQQMQQQQQQQMMQQQQQPQYIPRNDFGPNQRGQYNPNVTMNQMNAGVQYTPGPRGPGMLQRQLSQGQPMNHYQQQQQQQPGQYGQS